MSELQDVLSYHDRTKHHVDRYARSLGFLDWETQPDPFRRYEGAVRVRLALPAGPVPQYDSLFDGLPPSGDLDAQAVSSLLFDSLSLSAWKVAGRSRWSLRVNPSSGNLHPTEAYLVAGPVPGLHPKPALYHYAPKDHALELRADLAVDIWNDLSSYLPPGGFFVGLTTIVWREAWKYGERAFRYCQHDVGHAMAALGLSAAMRGWVCRRVREVDDDVLARLLGVAGQVGPEREHADVLMAVHPPILKERSCSFVLLPERLQSLRLEGRENRLSPDHHPWPILDQVAQATRKRNGTTPAVAPAPTVPSSQGDRPIDARTLVRGRRSAVAMDGRTPVPADDFFRMLSRLTPGPRWMRGLVQTSEVHLMLLVHRVTGLESGLYALTRNPADEPSVRAALDASFLWQEVAGCPPGVPLRLLVPGDVRDLAQTLSCHQEIASDGAFAVAMLARFRPALERHGAWYYRRLFWETGMIGQVLYLEAEAAGLGGTGIGCFFDDAVHDVLGVRDDAYQVLYHFTVGGPRHDGRLATFPAYEDREEA
jgi:SagB-type dehydrogenase family enzyme